jgi:phosphatidylserine/phosphatidylglycerophosphate/cardiolipin synthase-like enzyme
MTKHFLKAFLFLVIYSVTVSSGYAKLPSDWPKNGVLVLPDMGSTPILNAIRSAQVSIDVALYHLDDPAAIDALIDAKQRGVNVRVILHKPHLYPEPFKNSINEETSEKLKKHGITTHFLKDFYYTLTHYKVMIIDNDYALIQTFNFDDFNFNKARNFALTLQNKEQVEALQQIFDNDYRGQSAENDEEVQRLRDDLKIILGPRQQRETFVGFLRTAKKSVYIYQQDLSDPEIGQVLVDLAKEGKKVHVLMVPVPFGGIDHNRINQTLIQGAGGQFRFKPKSELYIHAKVALIDPEGEGQVYIGSCNFWPEALSRNREIGVISDNPSHIEAVFTIFKKDWQSSLGYEEAFEKQNKTSKKS